uniref:Uncharacterized protein n=1 Tax=Panagrolaimus sp. JU765 TaxID=591449 RepID=A0AC34Q2E5_9BILA
MMPVSLTAGQGVTRVMHRCEHAKHSNFLDLSSCNIMYVADAIYLVLRECTVKKCNLENNVIKKFPAKMVTKFPEMMHFSIANNEIAEIPEIISNWKKLKAINISRNKLKQFPEAMYNLKELNIIDLSYNQITELDIEKLCECLPNLQILNIAKNPMPPDHLQDVLNFARKIRRLKILYLAHD